MANKMSLILSFIFISLAIALAGDIVAIQLAYVAMDDVSMSAGDMLSKEGNINKVKEFVSSKNMEFVCDMSVSPMFGETYYYSITQKFRAIVMSNSELTLKIDRSTVIGYYF